MTKIWATILCNLYSKTIAFLVLIFLFSCLQDAPRNNPLDPRNPYTDLIPVIKSIDFYSCILNKGRKELELMLYIKIDDSKHPIEILYIDSPILKKRVPLNYITQDRTYHCKLTNNHFFLTSPDKIIGVKFQIIGIDRNHNEISIKYIEIKRIVKEDVNLLLLSACTILLVGNMLLLLYVLPQIEPWA